MAMKNDLSEGEVALLCALQKMREEMARAWKDLFEKNPEGQDSFKRLLEKCNDCRIDPLALFQIKNENWTLEVYGSKKGHKFL
jgi:hypothetical protein